MNLKLMAVLPVLLLTGCSIKQTVSPVAQAGSSEICLIEKPDVRDSFVQELSSALRKKGFEVRTLTRPATLRSCPMTATYNAHWRWDLALYMAFAEIRVYSDGQPAGHAVYDSMRGGANLGKFISAERKIHELVDSLFPQTVVR